MKVFPLAPGRSIRSLTSLVCALLLVFGCLLASRAAARAAAHFTIGTYNVENYLDAPSGTRKPKPERARAAVRDSILALQADVLALQEIGSPSALAGLVAALRERGLDYPHSEFVEGFDTNIYVAILSRFPVVARRSHPRESFLLQGRRLRTSRGFAEVDIRISADYTLTLLTAHLKSKREASYADHNDIREQEALVLRAKVDALLAARPDANLAVVGDFNDHRNSKSVRILIGRGPTALVDTRPTENPGAGAAATPAPGGARTVAWTHYYAQEETYSRIDYILVSRGLAREWQLQGTRVLVSPNWGEASDHRPIAARFLAADR